MSLLDRLKAESQSRMYVSERPISTGAYALFPYSYPLKRRFTHVSRYGDMFDNYRVMGDHIAIPRTCAPLGEEDLREEGLPIDVQDNFVPRNDDQEKFTARIAELMGEKHSFIAQAMTGFGKTVCMCSALARYGRKTLIVVTKEDIMYQWIDALQMVCGLEKKDIGLIKASSLKQDCPVVIASIQTLANDKIKESMLQTYGVLVVDEVHRIGADWFSNSIWKVPARVRVGLSATPDRKDGKGTIFRTHIGPVMVKSEVNTMVPTVMMVNTGFKLPRKEVVIGNHVEWRPIPHKAGRTGHITKMMAGHKGRNKIIVQFVSMAFEKGRRTIVFADTKKHLENLKGMLIDAGLPPDELAMYVGGMTDAKREKAKQKKVLLATYAFTSEATDIPWLDTAVLATPRAEVEQIVGRVRREYPDKKEPFVLDLVDKDSPVFSSYAKKRRAFYKRIGATLLT